MILCCSSLFSARQGVFGQRFGFGLHNMFQIFVLYFHKTFQSSLLLIYLGLLLFPLILLLLLVSFFLFFFNVSFHLDLTSTCSTYNLASVALYSRSLILPFENQLEILEQMEWFEPFEPWE